MPTTFMAASVPRYLRRSRLSYLPLSCVIGSHNSRTAANDTMIFDVIMLRPQAFQRMRTYVALQHVVAPAFDAKASFQPVYALQDVQQVTVPDNETDAEAFARDHFVRLYGHTGFQRALTVAHAMTQNRDR